MISGDVKVLISNSFKIYKLNSKLISPTLNNNNKNIATSEYKDWS
jgi:hypothetical protein